MPALVPFSPKPAKMKVLGLRTLRIDTGVSQDESRATAPHSILSRRASKLHLLANLFAPDAGATLRSSSPRCSPLYKPRRKMLRMQRRASPEIRVTIRTPRNWIKAMRMKKEGQDGSRAWHAGSGVQRLPSIPTQSHRKPSTVRERKAMDKDLMRLFQDAKDAGCVVQVGPCSPPPPSFSPARPVYCDISNALYSERASSASSRDKSSTPSTSGSASSTLSYIFSGIFGSRALSLSILTKNLSMGWRRFKSAKVREGMDFSQQPEALWYSHVHTDVPTDPKVCDANKL
jgi:hypothetical protein